MKAYGKMSKEELLALQAELQARYDKLKGEGIQLDMSRGKPGTDQLDLSAPMLDVLNSKSAFKGVNNIDVRNYGRGKRALCGIDGVPEGSCYGVWQFQPQRDVRFDFKGNGARYLRQHTVV